MTKIMSSGLIQILLKVSEVLNGVTLTASDFDMISNFSLSQKNPRIYQIILALNKPTYRSACITSVSNEPFLGKINEQSIR
jgi:hypothetical protein